MQVLAGGVHRLVGVVASVILEVAQGLVDVLAALLGLALLVAAVEQVAGLLVHVVTSVLDPLLALLEDGGLRLGVQVLGLVASLVGDLLGVVRDLLGGLANVLLETRDSVRVVRHSGERVR